MIITKKNWILSQIINGDMNPLHFDEGFARSKGFKSIIAPGIYVSSLIEKETYFKGCGQLNLKFVKEVYDGDDIHIIKNGEEFFWKNQNDEVVTKRDIKGCADEPKDLEGRLSYEKIVNEYDANKFYEILEMKGDGIPRMYVASLIPAALLRYRDKFGVYIKQELNFYKPVNIGDKISVYVKELNNRHYFKNYYTFCKNQNGELIIGGKATCVEIK